jgi:hypothetical protein
MPSKAEQVRALAKDFLERGLFAKTADAYFIGHIIVAHGIDATEALLQEVDAWRELHTLRHKEQPIGLGHRHRAGNV